MSSMKLRCQYYLKLLPQILPNIQRITYTYPSRRITKYWRGGNILKLTLWSYHDPDTETRQRYNQKRKLQANNFDKYTCKNTQQNISKPYPTTHKKDHRPWSSRIHTRVTRMAQHMQINQYDVPYQQKK